MTTTLDLPFCRSNTLVQALSILTKSSELQRRIDVHPLEEGVREAEQGCDVSAYPEYGYLSSVAKTERFGRALLRVLRSKELANVFLQLHRRYSANQLIGKLTQLRQHADKQGVPYDFFAVEAIRYWINSHVRTVGPEMDTPELDDLLREDVLAHVGEQWSKADVRLSHPVELKRWDPRFRSKRGRASLQHQAMHDFIAQRVSDAQAGGGDGSREVRRFLPVFMTEEEAVTRFDSELVKRAKAEPYTDLI